MAVANFFGKAALAAQHILHGIEYAPLVEMLNALTIGLAYDDASARSPEGIASLELAANLFARFYPRLSILSQGEAAYQLRSRLCDQMLAINPEIEILETEHAQAWLVVGNMVAPSAPAVYIGSEGWIARVSSQAPVGSGITVNPFGAAAAACFGVANIFRMVMSSRLDNAAPDTAFTLSMLDLEPNNLNPANPPWVPIDLGECHLVGLGAVGNAAVWMLARAPALTGALHLIDYECAELGNLQRYVLTTQTNQTAPKVEIAAASLLRGDLVVHPHQQRWAEYLNEKGNWNLPCVAVAVDTAEDRMAVQASLPKWLINAWTGGHGDVGVSRHGFIGEHACLVCLYYPRNKQVSEDVRVAQEIGLPDAVVEIRRYLYTNAGMSRELLERIATATNVLIDSLLEFEGQPLRAFYSRAICGGMILALGGHTHLNASTEVPMAFQSALAGVMLAAELVAHANQLKQAPPPVTTRINLLQPLAPFLSLAEGKEPSGKCICQDDDYVRAYNKKYAGGAG